MQTNKDDLKVKHKVSTVGKYFTSLLEGIKSSQIIFNFAVLENF
jgi:hypothetical protein